MVQKDAKKRGIVTRKRAAQRMDLIRRENVKRHNEFAARSALKAQQVAAQRVRQCNKNWTGSARPLSEEVGWTRSASTEWDNFEN